MIVASGGAAREPGRNVEHRVAPALAREVKIGWPGLNHLTRLGGSGGDRSLDIGLKFGEANPVLGDVELRGRIVDPRLRCLQGLLRRIEIRSGGEAALH